MGKNPIELNGMIWGVKLPTIFGSNTPQKFQENKSSPVFQEIPSPSNPGVHWSTSK